MKIAVFMGGSSEEREVSLMSGRAVYDGLKKYTHEVSLYDVEWIKSDSLFNTIETVKKDNVDVVFLALHGGLGENGGIQGILEAAGITYTGSGITASAVAMNKDITKSLLLHHGIPTPSWITLKNPEISVSRVEKEIGFPCVVKPIDQGSSIGINVVDHQRDLQKAIEASFKCGSVIMIEQFISGKEISVPILGETALPVIEIKPSHRTYDYECKYTSGMTEYFVPAPISDSIALEVGEYAIEVFSVLGLRDIARIDFRLDENGKPYCFEANTLPGMTATSLVPKSAAKAGMDFPALVSKISELALSRKGI
jgi:D-alanine-D-alanine ligase